MVRMNMCGLLWLSGWQGWIRNAWRIAWEDFARRGESRQPPSVINMNDVMRARITSTARTQTAAVTR
jgi:hypothetical protein